MRTDTTLAELWTTGRVLAGDDAGADEVLEAVVRRFSDPLRVSESRRLSVMVDAARGRQGTGVFSRDWSAALADGLARLPEEQRWAWLLAVGAGQPVADSEAALDAPGRVAGLVSDADRALRGSVEGYDSLARRCRERAWVTSGQSERGVARVMEATSKLRARRKLVNGLKLAAFGVAAGLLVYVLFDLQEAARREAERRRPQDLFSLPMEDTDAGVRR